MPIGSADACRGKGRTVAKDRGTKDAPAASIDRRTLLAGAGALTAGTMLATRDARAQAKVSPPNLIKPGTLVMSINPTLPPLQFVNDRGELQGMREELGNELAKTLGLTPSTSASSSPPWCPASPPGAGT
jgi:polar amino acid transport system substrate-binding protein